MPFDEVDPLKMDGQGDNLTAAHCRYFQVLEVAALGAHPGDKLVGVVTFVDGFVLVTVETAGHNKERALIRRQRPTPIRRSWPPHKVRALLIHETRGSRR